MKGFRKIQSKTKPITSLLASHFNLNSKQCTTSGKEKDEMKNVPYTSILDSLIYAMECTRPNIPHTVGVVNWFFFNLRKKHWACNEMNS